LELKEAKILIIDDEPQIRRLLRYILEEKNFKLSEASNGKEGLMQVNNFKPDLILLDLGLPDMDGQEVLKLIKGVSHTKVFILSVRNSEQDIVWALDNGADDYIVKPFNTNEMLARIRVALRNINTEEGSISDILTNGHIILNNITHIVTNSGQPVKLTATEYKLLNLFFKNIGRVLTHQYILKEIWGNPFSEQFQYLRVYVGQLRKKLEKNPQQPEVFLTEPGIGYRMSDIN
jgi:two-component system KDP operon response regulator KdpE